MTPVPGEVAYLGACALGMAFSPSPADDPVAVLMDAADGDVTRLTLAHEAVLSVSAADSKTRQRAARMLVAAARALERDLATADD